MLTIWGHLDLNLSAVALIRVSFRCIEVEHMCLQTIVVLALVRENNIPIILVLSQCRIIRIVGRRLGYSRMRRSCGIFSVERAL